MAEAFVQILVDNISSFLQGELVLFFGFENELENLSSRFSTVQAVLEDAQEKQLKDKAIKNWLQKLNAAAYKIDDMLDECKYEAARFKQSRLGRCHPGIMTFCHKIGKRMKEMMEKLEAIAKERKDFHLHEKLIERQAARRETGSILIEPEVYGRKKEEDEIVKILINNVSNAQNFPGLPILGMGGLGKTTLAQRVFNDQRMIKHFHPKIWICVSEDFDEKRLIKAIIVESIEGRPLLGDMDLAPLQIKLQELLNRKRYFLVLDDVWNENPQKWDNLRAVLKVGESGASVLTTTRLEKVGLVMGTLQPYRLSNLSEEDCWSLLMQCAFGHQEEINPNLAAIGKEIVKKCGGVPLGAKTLGGLLRFKREEREWEHVRDSEIWNLPQDESTILPFLSLSYHHLPLDLRQCFLYCAVYPKDTIMEKENLITLWIALSKGNLDLEYVGNEVWNELYMRSFFQEIEVKSGRTYFKMHDLIHDLATSLFSASTSSSNIREIHVRNYSNHRMSIGFPEVVSSYSPSLLKMSVSLRVLDLSRLELEQLPSSIGDLVHLRYLDLSRNVLLRSLPKSLCKLQNLKTLILNRCSSLCCLPKQTSKLGSLQHLFLDDCPLAAMPPRIGSLTCRKSLSFFIIGKRKGYQLGELKNLDLHGSISIKHLERVKNETKVKEANLSAKANLQSLSMFWDLYEPHRYESEEVKVLEVLKPHPCLKSLEITGFRGFHFPNWISHSVLERVASITISHCKNCSCLPPFGELPCLESLELHYGSAEVEYVDEYDVDSGFPTRRRFPSLRKLVIRDFPNMKGLLIKKVGEEQCPVLEEGYYVLPYVFPTLSSVKKLRIWGKVDAAGLCSISNLRTLTDLSISHNNEATSLPEEMFKSLVNLKNLHINYLGNLKELPTSVASLNALQLLHTNSCRALESLPEGLQHLTVLTVHGSPELKKRYEKGIGRDWHKIAHICIVDS
ncbi:putative disease resistance protein RGA3 [Capsicum annuum]|uniref:Disease resistance protein RGA3 n=1 Tax=Capsicum annuum TaxID=4072 RepID=A0A1U8GGQ0_CAPAN|nr:putative disease resistance protein RGA3 [Capsicum annuum]KAF3650255.1 putative disease resistance protein RGA3 [Capsicum annuum]PHT93101.1 putative disease resistance protein RGA3 [Capsicum annuum]